jgi:cytochrome b561
MHKPADYSRTQIVLHWLIAVLVAGQYVLHQGIERAWNARLDGTLPNEPFPNPHAIIGMVILVLTVWRIVLRVRGGAPDLPENEPRALKVIASATHLAFYALLVGMPLSGAAAWVLGFQMPAQAHEIAAKVMLGLIALHIAGAIVQTVWLKSGVMARMSPKRALKRPA